MRRGILEQPAAVARGYPQIQVQLLLMELWHLSLHQSLERELSNRINQTCVHTTCIGVNPCKKEEVQNCFVNSVTN